MNNAENNDGNAAAVANPVKINQNCPLLDMEDPKHNNLEAWAFTVLYTCDQANKWNVKAALGNMVNYSKGETTDTLMNLNIDNITTVPQLVQKVKEELAGISGFSAWTKVMDLTQHRSESLRGYFNRARKLYKNCGETNFDYYCKSIIRGMANEVEKRSFAEKTFTNMSDLEAAVDTAIRIQKDFLQKNGNNHQDRQYLARHDNNPYDMEVDEINTNDEEFDDAAVERIEARIMRCWICDNPNHRKKDCPRNNRVSRGRGRSAPPRSGRTAGRRQSRTNVSDRNKQPNKGRKQQQRRGRIQELEEQKQRIQEEIDGIAKDDNNCDSKTGPSEEDDSDNEQDFQ